MDRRIVMELQEDGRRSYRQMGETLGVAPGTVRLRVLQLLDDGVLQVIGVPNPWRLGFRFHATVALRVTPGFSREVGQILSSRAEVGWVGLMSGGFDVMFEVTLPDSRDFKEDVLARLPGCQAVEVFEVWEIPKYHYRLQPPTAEESISERDDARPAFGDAARTPKSSGPSREVG